MNEAAIAVELPDEQVARAVHAALQPEAAHGPEGSTTVVELRGRALHARIDARDVSTLRAAINSVLRLADAARAVVHPEDPNP